ncbi:RHS repeat domain-containing protein [Lentzea sp. NPDC102401]|uniref:RHS repeat domain-containing protein n=1 Tax=Lentzea sp. NPDC102401 TaxID=3364128 RepID=UPI0037F2173E
MNLPNGGAQTTTSTYDDSGKLLAVSLDGETLTSVTYDAAGEISSVDYANGSSLVSIGKDAAGRATSNRWRTSTGAEIVSAVTRTRAGTIVDESLGGVDARPGGPNCVYDFASNAPTGCVAGAAGNAGLNGNPRAIAGSDDGRCPGDLLLLRRPIACSAQSAPTR